MHPNQVRDLERKAAQVEAMKQLDEDLEKYAKEVGLRYMHDQDARISLAWTMTGQNVLEVSTGLCHPNDAFSKKAGRRIAGLNHMDGNVVKLRKPAREIPTRQFLEFAFIMPSLPEDMARERAIKMMMAQGGEGESA